MSGIYLDSKVGWSDLVSMPTPETIGAERVSVFHFPSYRFGIGYLHNFTSLFGFGFEIGRGLYSTYRYHRNGNSTIKAAVSTYEFLSLMVWHLSLRYDLVVKLGGCRSYFRVSTTHFDSAGPATKIRPIAIIGIAYTFYSHLALVGSYYQLFSQKIKNFDTSSEWKVPSVNAVLVGIRITF